MACIIAIVAIKQFLGPNFLGGYTCLPIKIQMAAKPYYIVKVLPLKCIFAGVMYWLALFHDMVCFCDSKRGIAYDFGSCLLIFRPAFFSVTSIQYFDSALQHVIWLIWLLSQFFGGILLDGNQSSKGVSRPVCQCKELGLQWAKKRVGGGWRSLFMLTARWSLVPVQHCSRKPVKH